MLLLRKRAGLLGKKVMRNTCGLENDEVTKKKRKLHNKHL
jgi:hypothetical protein